MTALLGPEGEPSNQWSIVHLSRRRLGCDWNSSILFPLVHRKWEATSSMWNPETSKVLDALEKLGSPVSIAQVVSETGLPTNVVEAEMASILHATQGFFELPSRKGEAGEAVESSFIANVFDASNVRYVYPSNIRPMLERKDGLLRLSTLGRHVWSYVFVAIRVSFGVVLLVSIVVIVVVAVVVSARASNDRRGTGTAGHHVVRLFRPRGYYGNTDMNQWFWWWWWYNQNPFFVGANPGAAQQYHADQEQRRLMAQMDELDEEDGAAAATSRRRRNRGGAQGDERDRMMAEGPGDELGFLEAVFSFLFGDGHPGPSDDERWQVVAGLIRRQEGVIVPEEVVPYLPVIEARGGDIDTHTCMLPVLTRFGGRPVPCPPPSPGDTTAPSGATHTLIYDFPRLREACPVSPAGSDCSSASASSSLASQPTASSVACVYERPHAFSRAPMRQLQMAGALGLINMFGAVWLVDKAGELEGMVISPLVNTAMACSRGILIYASLYLLVPLLRMVVIAYLNATVERRNGLRRGLLEEYERQMCDPKSGLSGRMAQASAYRSQIMQG